MSVLSYNDRMYFINGSKPQDEAYKKFFVKGRGRPTEEIDYFLACRKHFAFQPQFLYEGYEDLSWIYSFFCDLEQPSEQKVRRAMILTLADNCGDGPMNKYMLKAGGGSMSDSIFVSSYSILTAHPQTGEDTWRVLMKKYSTTFSDVLITYEEIKALFDQVATKDQVVERDADYAKSVVALLMSSVNTGNIPQSGGKYKKATPEALQSIIDTHKPQASDDLWKKAFEFFEQRLKESMTRQFVEDKPGRCVTDEHRLSELKRLSALHKVEDMFYQEVRIRPELPQLDLFAA